MNPQVATLFSVILIIGLLYTDLKKKTDGVSKAIWVPFFWMFFAGSRYASQWLNLGAPSMGGAPDAYLEGSSLDRAVFLFLIFLGVLILKHRNIKDQLGIRNCPSTGKGMNFYVKGFLRSVIRYGNDQ